MSQISTAIGMLMWLPVPNSSCCRAWTDAGSSLPRITPAAMQSATQSDRERSKTFIRFGTAAGIGAYSHKPRGTIARGSRISADALVDLDRRRRRDARRLHRSAGGALHRRAAARMAGGRADRRDPGAPRGALGVGGDAHAAHPPAEDGADARQLRGE